MKLFFVAGIGIAVFIELLLISKRKKSASDRILTVWMFLITVHVFLYYLYFTEDIVQFPFLLGLEHPLPMLHSVFLYLYVCHVTKLLPRDRRVLFLHLVPAGIIYAYLVPFFILPADQKIWVYRNKGAGYEWFMYLKVYATTISGVGYVIWSALLLRRHARIIRDRFSDLEKVSLRWLRILTYGLGGIWLIVLVTRNDLLVYTGVIAFIFLIGFFGIRQGDIFSQSPMQPEPAGPQPETEGSQPESDGTRKKYTKSGLSDMAAEELHKALIALMEEDELYRKSDLSINELALKMGAHPNYLSQVINQKEAKNFYDFVNSYRVEAFKRMIKENKNQRFTLLSLAYDCGFSSKSSFNRCFKKVTGLTPSQYSTMASEA